MILIIIRNGSKDDELKISREQAQKLDIGIQKVRRAITTGERFYKTSNSFYQKKMELSSSEMLTTDE